MKSSVECILKGDILHQTSLNDIRIKVTQQLINKLKNNYNYRAAVLRMEITVFLTMMMMIMKLMREHLKILYVIVYLKIEHLVTYC